MSSLSVHFKREEFACKCGCGFDTVDSHTLDILESVRAHFGRPVVINSGCRCAEYNERIGGSKHSQHLRGRAADISVVGTEPSDVADFIEATHGHTCSIGRYETFTHVDTRSGHCARWGEN